MSKRVLYISYDGMTDPLGQSQVLPYLTGLSRLGHKIVIVSAEKRARFSMLGEMMKRELMEKDITWHTVIYSNDYPGISAYATYNRLLRKSFQLHREFNFDLTHCRSYIPSLIGLKLKIKYRVKFLFDMRGFWADERVEGKIWNLKNPLYRRAYHFFKRKEKEFLRESDAIVSLTENAKEEILSWRELKITSDKITVIPCCADLEFFSEKNIDPGKQQLLRDDLGIDKNDFVLSYSGSIGTWYLLNEMLIFFRHMLDEKPDGPKESSLTKFLFITPDGAEKIIAASTEARIPADKLVIRSVSRKDMPLYLSLSRASIFFIKNSFSKKASSPTKMGEVMSLGIPIICNSGVGDVERIMKESNAGVVIDSFNEEQYKASVKRLLESSFSKQSIREGAEKFFSLEKGIKRYHEIYSTL